MNDKISRRVVRRINTRNQTIGFNQLRVYVQDLEDRIVALEKIAIERNVPLINPEDKKPKIKKMNNKEIL